MRRFFKTIFAALFAVGGWLWTGATILMNWIGRSTLYEDTENALSLGERGLNWLFSTPWWVPGFLGAVATFFLFYVFWPRGQQPYLAVIAGTKVILPSPKQIMNGHCRFGPEYTHDLDKVIATGAPPHSIANVRYRVTATDGQITLAGVSPRIAIREVGSNDAPILEGVGFAEVHLNRQSEFEVSSTCGLLEEKPWVHIELWLIGWITT